MLCQVVLPQLKNKVKEEWSCVAFMFSLSWQCTHNEKPTWRETSPLLGQAVTTLLWRSRLLEFLGGRQREVPVYPYDKHWNCFKGSTWETSAKWMAHTWLFLSTQASFSSELNWAMLIACWWQPKLLVQGGVLLKRSWRDRRRKCGRRWNGACIVLLST